MMRFVLTLLLIALTCGLATASAQNVLVVVNTGSLDSVAVAQYYAAKRRIPSSHICKIKCPTDEVIKEAVFEKDIKGPIKAFLETNGIKDKIDYIVLTKGIPIKTNGRYGVDSALTCMFSKGDRQLPNPYFNARTRFSHKDYDMYLVTRLDGLTVSDAKALVDRSLRAKPNKGLFLLDIQPSRDGSPGYKPMNDSMRHSAAALKKKSFRVELEETNSFVSRTGLMGYFSWGKNDGGYSQETFNKLRFDPGSIAEMAESTSAYTLTSKRTLKGNRSYITDLVAQGATGVKGYVFEPYLYAVADPVVLFDRYTTGYNLAESFYAASRVIHWQDIILGDPLCAPYARQE